MVIHRTPGDAEEASMGNGLPGSKTRAVLERGIPTFRNGLCCEEATNKAGCCGCRKANQIVVDRVSGNCVRDTGGRRYVD